MLIDTVTHWLIVLVLLNVYAWYALDPVAVFKTTEAFGLAQVGITPSRFTLPVWVPVDDVKDDVVEDPVAISKCQDGEDENG